MNYKEYKVRVYDNGTKEWYLNGKLHREDGPAIERADRTKHWYLNGKYNREDGPAVEHANGTKHWFFNGRPHRKDGPAIENADGTKEWYLNGKLLTEEEFNNKTKDDCNGKVVEIEGKKYKLTLVVEQKE